MHKGTLRLSSQVGYLSSLNYISSKNSSDLKKRNRNNSDGLPNASYHYRIHTDAIKHNLIPSEITKSQASVIYANEADVLNVAMFGVTAKQWRDANPDLKGNIRDYASINELICLSNMENLNAVFIEQGIPQSERLMKLNQIAIHQMSIFESSDSDRKFLK